MRTIGAITKSLMAIFVQTLPAILGRLFLDRPSQACTMHALCRSEEAAMEVAVERHGEQNRQGEKETVS
jgi:hypothetical protein